MSAAIAAPHLLMHDSDENEDDKSTADYTRPNVLSVEQIPTGKSILTETSGSNHPNPTPGEQAVYRTRSRVHNSTEAREVADIDASSDESGDETAHLKLHKHRGGNTHGCKC